MYLIYHTGKYNVYKSEYIQLCTAVLSLMSYYNITQLFLKNEKFNYGLINSLANSYVLVPN